MSNSSRLSGDRNRTARIVVSGGIFIASLLLLMTAEAALAQTAAQQLQQKASDIVPQLQVPIQGVDITKAIREDSSITVPFLAQYIGGVYRFLVSIVGVLAGVMIMVGGFQYLTAGGDKTRVDAGKERIMNAVSGLVLALGSYVLLYTINPNLVEFKGLQFPIAQNVPLPPIDTDEGDLDPAIVTGNYACKTIEECRALCLKPKSSWPLTAPSVLDPNLVKNIPTLSNLQNNRAIQGSENLIAGLTRANEFAKSEGVVIKLSSGYRPLRDQIRIVCDDFIAKKREGKIGTAVAWPGGSNHGAGKAVDLWIERGADTLTTTSYDDQSNSKWKDGSILLDKIMTQAGFRRYGKEIWHFEIGTTKSCLCQYPNCPFPPKC